MTGSQPAEAGFHQAYRPDVDGLRAVAVLSVVAYHAGESLLPGGYLGVDIFFVLSGFLITTIIWLEIDEDRFSIGRFYERRIRRIMPALLLVLTVSCIVAVLILLPKDLVRFGASLLASLAFVANIYFWRDTNYFAPAAEQKPLLHLWSLGVEEQFYILFPLFLLVLARVWRRGVMPVLVLLTLGSLAVNVFALVNGGQSPAFFLLPTRAWELGAGAILAVIPPSVGFAEKTRLAGLLAGLGAVLIGFGLVFPIEDATLFSTAIPAVLGASLIVLAGRQATSLPARLLSLRPVVFVGLISYSLYLWHWPIFVFAEYWLIRELTLTETGLAFILMLAAAYLSWRFVERPFRARTTAFRRVAVAVAGASVLVAGVAAAFVATRGLPARLNPEAATINAAVDTNYRCPIFEYIAFGASRACLLNLPSRSPADADVVLLGNSHAQMYAPVWEDIIRDDGRHGLLVPANGCLPTVDANITADCIATARRNLEALNQLPRVQVVILGLTWSHAADSLVDANGATLDNRGNRALIAALDGLIDRLRANGKKVVLIGPNAEPGYDIASVVSRKLAFGRRIDDPMSRDRADFMRRYGTAIRHFEARSDVRFVRPDRIQCHAERCEYMLDGRPLFADSNHIAEAELTRFRPMFEAALGAQAR